MITVLFLDRFQLPPKNQQPPFKKKSIIIPLCLKWITEIKYTKNHSLSNI